MREVLGISGMSAPDEFDFVVNPEASRRYPSGNLGSLALIAHNACSGTDVRPFAIVQGDGRMKLRADEVMPRLSRSEAMAVASAFGGGEADSGVAWYPAPSVCPMSVLCQITSTSSSLTDGYGSGILLRDYLLNSGEAAIP